MEAQEEEGLRFVVSLIISRQPLDDQQRRVSRPYRITRIRKDCTPRLVSYPSQLKMIQIRSKYLTTRSSSALKLAETVPIIYVEGDGTEKEVQAEIGKNMLDVAHDNNVELEGKSSLVLW